MFYYEKNYIMRMIHGYTRAIAKVLFNRELEDEVIFTGEMDKAGREKDDYLKRMVDEGRVNAAEEKLFNLLRPISWENKQKAALMLSFYDHLNEKDDEFLAAANFSREENHAGNGRRNESHRDGNPGIPADMRRI